MKNRVSEDISFIDVNPLDEAVNEKRYTQPNINTTGIDFNKPIDEPSFTPPPFTKTAFTKTAPTGNFSGGGPSSSGSKQSGNSGGLGGNDENLSKKDLKVGAESAADMTIAGYEWLHVLGNKWLQISPKRLQRMEEAGEINLQAMIDYDVNHRITAGEFIQQFNEQVSNVLTVSDEFKEEIKPLLVELFMKKGVKISLETRIMIVVGKDLAAKMFIIAQQKQQTKIILQAVKDATANQMAPPPPPPPPPPQPAPQPEPTRPSRDEVIIVEPEEFEVDSKAVVLSEKKPRKPRKYEI
jgi:hypothetical protein